MSTPFSRLGEVPARVLSPGNDGSQELWTPHLTVHTTAVSLALASIGILAYCGATSEGVDLLQRMFNGSRLVYFAQGLKVVPIAIEFSLIVHYLVMKIWRVRASQIRHAQDWLEEGRNRPIMVRALSNEGPLNRCCTPNLTLRITELTLAILGAIWLVVDATLEKPNSFLWMILNGSRINSFAIGLITSALVLEGALGAHLLFLHCLNRRG